MTVRPTSSLECLEGRIAPALVVLNPLADIIAGLGQTGATVELTAMFDETVQNAGHTIVRLTTNFDTDPDTPGIQAAVIEIELFDDEAPLTVQNFLSYLQNDNARADFVDTFFHRAVTNFVLQGGGYETRSIYEHIPTQMPVHNEFSESRSNVRGTIAMAKTALSPHSATSEWFINLADNSANLDEQNGGFTVFGVVRSDMSVIDAIAALPRQNFGGALTDTPVQNYNPDPDNNPFTPPPAPTSDQLVRITGFEVVPPATGSISGVTLSIDSITGPAGLVTGTIVDGKLHLAYGKNKSGVAEVTIKATKDGESVTETFTVTVKPNLIVGVANESLNTILVPSDKGSVKVMIGNNGAAVAKGKVDVYVYLSRIEGGVPDAEDRDGNLYEPGKDILIGTAMGKSINLASGKTKLLSVKLNLPDELLDQNSQHRLLVVVKPSAEIDQIFAGTDEEPDDDLGVSNAGHLWVNGLGNIAAGQFIRPVKSLTIDPDGDGPAKPVTLSLKGPGTVLIDKDNGGMDLFITNTTVQSSLTAKVAKGESFALRDLEIAQTIGAVKLGATSISGVFTASGGAKSIVLGDVTGPSMMTLGAFAGGPTQKATITLGKVTNVAFNSQMPIGKLTAIDWVDTGGLHETIVAPSIDQLRITGSKFGDRGDFGVNLTTTSSTRMSVFSVAGLMENSHVRVNGDVNTVTIGAMSNSSFYAGADDRPEDLADFTSSLTIRSFTLKGVLGVAAAMSNSDVAARQIRTINLPSVDGATGSEEFGFIADAIKTYNRTGSPKLTKLDSPGAFDVNGNYAVRIL